MQVFLGVNLNLPFLELEPTWAVSVGSHAGYRAIEIALCKLASGEAELSRLIVESDGDEAPAATVAKAEENLTDSTSRLRASGQQDELPSALIALAWMQWLQGNAIKANSLLDEAWLLAERGPMQLHMADIHLHRARLFRDRNELSKAQALIEHYAYGFRENEIADAIEAAKNW